MTQQELYNKFLLLSVKFDKYNNYDSENEDNNSKEIQDEHNKIINICYSLGFSCQLDTQYLQLCEKLLKTYNL